MYSIFQNVLYIAFLNQNDNPYRKLPSSVSLLLTPRCEINASGGSRVEGRRSRLKESRAEGPTASRAVRSTSFPAGATPGTTYGSGRAGRGAPGT